MFHRAPSERYLFKRYGRGLRAAILVSSAYLVSLTWMGTASADEGDPPSRIARLSFMQGAVSLQPAGVQDWAPATLNRPLTTGDKLWADQDSRAELDMGFAAVRVGPTTGVSFLNLDDRVAQLDVTAGTAIVHLRDLGPNQTFEVDTPNMALSLQGPGDYRVDVNDSGSTSIVRISDGAAQASATGQTLQLGAQQAVTFTGTDQVTADATAMGAPDELDEWSLDREHQAEQAQSNQYVPPDMTGGQDLDNYGTWSSVPDYGYVWTPSSVGPDWAPYTDGRWVWVSPWGWTWVDAAPWGFAPFHYGRWASIDGRWCWVPGPRRDHPVYAPALVAWVGTPGAAIAVGAGAAVAVGWFALGPREVYVPGYHVSPAYVRNVNVTNTTIVNNTYITNVYENKVTNITYVNRNAPGAVSTVPRSVFTSAQPVAGRITRVPPAQLARLTVQGSAPAIVPERQSVLGSAVSPNVRRPPAAFANRPVVARTPPPPPSAPFAREQAAIRANGGRPIARSLQTQMQAQAASSHVRVVAPSPVRQLAPARGSGPTSLTDRERTLHSTPLPERSDRPPSAQPNYDRPNQQLPQTRPMPEARPIPQAHPIPEARPIEPQPAPQERSYSAPPAARPQAATPPPPSRAVETPHAAPAKPPAPAHPEQRARPAPERAERPERPEPH